MATKVLVIDDDLVITDMLTDLLKAEGFEVHVRNSGREGINAVRDIQPDVILLDLMMPGMNGWQVCREIRSFSPIPILILSAVVDSQDVIRALDEGADDYMVKPVTRGVLAARLKRLAR